MGRLIQGLTASIVWTIGLAIIADTGDLDNMAFLMSFPGIGVSLRVFLGPFLGGILYEKAGYYSVFYIFIGVLVLDLGLRLFMLEKAQLYKYRYQSAVEFSHKDTSALLQSLSSIWSDTLHSQFLPMKCTRPKNKSYRCFMETM